MIFRKKVLCHWILLRESKIEEYFIKLNLKPLKPLRYHFFGYELFCDGKFNLS